MKTHWISREAFRGDIIQ